MNTKDEQELVENFLGSYFHEDWDLEADNPDDIIFSYLKARQRDLKDLQRLANAIREYGNSCETDEKLEERLLEDAGCYFSPELAGLSAHAWLDHVASLLTSSQPKI